MAASRNPTSDAAEVDAAAYAASGDNSVIVAYYPSPEDRKVEISAKDLSSLLSETSSLPTSILRLRVQALRVNNPKLKEMGVLLCLPPGDQPICEFERVKGARKIIWSALYEMFEISTIEAKGKGKEKAKEGADSSAGLLASWELIGIPLQHGLRWSLLVFKRRARKARSFDTSWDYWDPRTEREVTGKGYNNGLVHLWASEVTEFLHKETSKLAGADGSGPETFLSPEEKLNLETAISREKRYDVFGKRAMLKTPQTSYEKSGAVVCALLDLVVERVLSIGVDGMKEDPDPNLEFDDTEVLDKSKGVRREMQNLVESTKKAAKG